jgi:hypothetical protein
MGGRGLGAEARRGGQTRGVVAHGAVSDTKAAAWCQARRLGVVSEMRCQRCGVGGVVSETRCQTRGVRDGVSETWCQTCGVSGVVSETECQTRGVRRAVSVARC